MSSLSFVPLDRFDSGAPIGSGLVPSVSRTQALIDQVRGRSTPTPAASARAIEDTMGIALGAALSGAAAANGWSSSATALAGLAAAVYGVMNGHPMMTNVGRGMFAPYVAELARTTFAKPAPAVAAPTAAAAPAAAA